VYKLEDACRDLVMANRILSNEEILDAFGHVSMRHPTNPERYLLSALSAPELVREADILEFTLDSEPLTNVGRPLYSERIIHGCIYRQRPDVHAICHHHAPGILPYCVSGRPLLPVSQLGAVIGSEAPFWDSRDEFGDTNLLLTKPEEGASLARGLGNHWVVLMRRHGATVVGRGLREMVFRTIQSCRNAEVQARAAALGNVDHLSAGEIAMAGDLRAGPIDRAWQYWVERLRKSDASANVA
jgi:HCOMODA/2-hydroxy-3-carboxy-muconic semialdehyde decarboxylase